MSWKSSQKIAKRNIGTGAKDFTLKTYNTYFRGFNETPGGNTGTNIKPGPKQLSSLATNIIFYRDLKNLPMPGEYMTDAQKDFFDYLTSRKPLSNAFALVVDLSGNKQHETYIRVQPCDICEQEWDKYRYFFADERADKIQLGSFLYRNRSVL